MTNRWHLRKEFKVEAKEMVIPRSSHASDPQIYTVNLLQMQETETLDKYMWTHKKGDA
jgi:hypothetical protein